jgi:tetratricopeptide (TPR) repeat protein
VDLDRNPRARLALAALLAAATFALYARTGGHRFLQFDDPLYVTANAVVARGLTTDGIAWAFTTLEASNWHPFAWLSHMLDVELFGQAPGPHHLVNAGLHGLNAAVLFLVLSRITGAALLSLAVAALFAVHPLHVESVAWVSERKDLLSTLFGFLAVGAWARHAARPSVARYLVVVVLLAASLLSKAMWITFPFLLLLLDAWPLQRVAARWNPSDPRPPVLPRVGVRRLLLEKAPFLVLCLAVGAVALAAQARGGSMNSLDQLPLLDRLANSASSYLAYLAKTAWPAGLSAWYPLREGGARWLDAGAALLLAAATAGSFAVARRMPWVPVGWLWFVGMLVPVIGLVQVGSQAMADRYTYVPLVGVFVAVAWTLDAAARTAAARRALGAAAVVAILALAFATWARTADWRDQVTLFSRALEATGPNGRAHHLLSQGYVAEGRWPEALLHAREAARLDPLNPRTHKNLGYVLYRSGLVDDAIVALERAVALDPTYAEARGNLAIAYGKKGRMEDAMREMRLEKQLREGRR